MDASSWFRLREDQELASMGRSCGIHAESIAGKARSYRCARSQVVRSASTTPRAGSASL